MILEINYILFYYISFKTGKMRKFVHLFLVIWLSGTTIGQSDVVQREYIYRRNWFEDLITKIYPFFDVIINILKQKMSLILTSFKFIG